MFHLYEQSSLLTCHAHQQIYLTDSTEPSVWLTTSSEGVTKDPYINLLIHFTKPIFGFEASTVEAQGGTVIRQVHSRLFSLLLIS